MVRKAASYSAQTQPSGPRTRVQSLGQVLAQAHAMELRFGQGLLGCEEHFNQATNILTMLASVQGAKDMVIHHVEIIECGLLFHPLL